MEIKFLTMRSKVSYAVLQRHQQRIYVFEALEFGLVDFLNNTWIIGSEVNRFIGKFRRKVCQIAVGVQPGLVRRRYLFLF